MSIPKQPNADLVPVHGGLSELVDRTVSLKERGAFLREAASLPSIHVSNADLSTVFRRVVPGKGAVSELETEDLAGEMANKILGRLKEYYIRRGQIFGIASPVYLRGDVAVRYKAGRPSLVLPFEEAEGTLFVQFCIDTSNPAVGAEPAGEVAEDTTQSGDLLFL